MRSLYNVEIKINTVVYAEDSYEAEKLAVEYKNDCKNDNSTYAYAIKIYSAFDIPKGWNEIDVPLAYDKDQLYKTIEQLLKDQEDEY